MLAVQSLLRYVETTQYHIPVDIVLAGVKANQTVSNQKANPIWGDGAKTKSCACFQRFVSWKIHVNE